MPDTNIYDTPDRIIKFEIDEMTQEVRVHFEKNKWQHLDFLYKIPQNENISG